MSESGSCCACNLIHKDEGVRRGGGNEERELRESH